MRLIDADKLLEWRHTFASDFGRICAEMFISAIDQEETIEIPKWIHVSNRLPKDGQRVFILLKDGRTYSADFYCGDSDWWFEIDNGNEYCRLVRAWMFIPEHEEGE